MKNAALQNLKSCAAKSKKQRNFFFRIVIPIT